MKRRASGYDRVKDDWYVESRASVDALFEQERFPGPVWDPACGAGNIVEAALDRGIEAFGSDIRTRAKKSYLHEADFLVRDDVETLLVDRGGKVGSILSNPPYRLAARFVERALELAEHKVAMILPLAFLEGERRRALFDRAPPSRVLVARNRVSMPPGGSTIEAKGGTVVYCWMIWTLPLRPGRPPELGWFGTKLGGESRP